MIPPLFRFLRYRFTSVSTNSKDPQTKRFVFSLERNSWKIYDVSIRLFLFYILFRFISILFLFFLDYFYFIYIRLFLLGSIRL